MRMQKPWLSVTCLPAKWKRLFSGTGKRQSLLDQKEQFKFSITDENTVKFEEASYFENLALNISYIGYKILALNSEDGNIVAKLKEDKFSIVAISYDASDFITAKCERL